MSAMSQKGHLLALASLVLGVVASFVITWLAWEIQIEGHAYDCIG